jgi:hypothetical protein
MATMCLNYRKHISTSQPGTGRCYFSCYSTIVQFEKGGAEWLENLMAFKTPEVSAAWVIDALMLWRTQQDCSVKPKAEFSRHETRAYSHVPSSSN